MWLLMSFQRRIRDLFLIERFRLVHELVDIQTIIARPCLAFHGFRPCCNNFFIRLVFACGLLAYVKNLP